MAKKLDRCYIRVDADFASDERFLSMPSRCRDQAWIMFLTCVGHARKVRSDGYLSASVVAMLGRSLEHSTRHQGYLLDALRQAGLLEPTKDGWWIPKYEKWQDTAEEIARHSEAGRAGGAASGAARRQRIVHGSLNGSLNGSSSQTETETETETYNPPYAPPSRGGRGRTQKIHEEIDAEVARLKASRGLAP